VAEGAGHDPEYPYEIEFYDDPETGRMPVYEWILELHPLLRGALGTALREVLQRHGLAVCQGEWGKHLGGGVFEFRVRHSAEETVRMFTRRAPKEEPRPDKIALRVFGHAHGNKLVLLLAGYDKSADPSDRREEREIELARKRLAEYRGRQRSR
jgi:hypothetical protein